MVKVEQQKSDLLSRLTAADWENLALRIPAKQGVIKIKDGEITKLIVVPFTPDEIDIIQEAIEANNRIGDRNRRKHLHHVSDEPEWYYYNLYGGENFPSLGETVNRRAFVGKIRRATSGLNVNNMKSSGSDLNTIRSLPGRLIALDKKR